MHRSFVDFMFLSAFASALLSISSVQAEWQPEQLDRGLVAVKNDDGVFLSWRLFPSDPDDVQFRVFRKLDREVSQVTASATSATNLTDPDGEVSAEYAVVVADTDKEVDLQELRDWRRVWNGYLEIAIQTIDGYQPGDASVGDLDGDGTYEIVLHQVSKPRDNSHSGITGTPILDAYRLDGTHLWRIDLGVNIREGEHYTQLMVYDLDGDGRAEVACKTADGSRDGLGDTIGDANADYRNLDADDKRFGRVLDGPEFLTVFDGLTGKARHTVPYQPSRDPVDGWGGIGGNGGNDSYGNRCDRFLACIAYLDRVNPSLVMCRGVYGRTAIVAWDWRDGKLDRRWVFDTGPSYPPFRDVSPFAGMGGHSLSVADVDDDGRDEIVYQAMVVDDDGTGLYSTGLRHGDSLHVSDMDPERPGLEAYTISENEGSTVRFQTPGAAMRDARTGEILWSHSPGIDIKRGLAADVDPRQPGYEAWSERGGLRGTDGQRIGPAPRTTNFVIWWDGDLLRELIGRTEIRKWNWLEEREDVVFRPEATSAKRGPNLVADLMGDWREELLLTSPDGKSLRLYTTTIATDHRINTLMHDRQYRLGIAWQNVVYNKPAHPSFFLGSGSAAPR